MNDFESQWPHLKQVEPDARWLADTKSKMMDCIETEQAESLLSSWFKRAALVMPDLDFTQQARFRLMKQIEKSAQTGFWGFRRFLASALVMLLAVGTTMIFSEGKTTVMANDAPTLEVLMGEVTVQEDLLWEKVTGWREIKEGDLFRTNATVDATFHFNENQLRLGPNTVLLVSQVTPQGEVRFNLSHGSVWLSAPSQKEQKGFVSIETPNVSVLTPNASVWIKAEPLGASSTVQVFDGALRSTYIDPGTKKSQVQVMEAGQMLQVYGKKQGQGVTHFDLEEAKQNPEVLAHLKRDEMHRQYLKKLNTDRLKRMLSE